MNRSPNIVVAGAGALGLTSALALARRGARVTVFDPAPPGDNASGVAAGMLAPVFEAVLDASTRPHFDLLCAARDLWPELAAGLGLSLARDGALAVGDESWLQAVGAALDAVGADARPVTGEALRLAAPGLDRRFGRGLWTGADWRVEAGPALAALKRAAEAAGVGFRQSAATGDEPCDLMLAATGAAQGLAGLAPELGGLIPIKGHILRLPGALRTVVRGSEIYAAPGGGGVLIGATMEMGVADRRVDPVKAARLQAAAASLFPGFARTAGTARTGVRAASADGLPLAGWSGAENVLLAAGARRNGWLLAPLVAQVIAALAFGDDPGPYAARLDPGRFNSPG